MHTSSIPPIQREGLEPPNSEDEDAPSPAHPDKKTFRSNPYSSRVYETFRSNPYSGRVYDAPSSDESFADPEDLPNSLSSKYPDLLPQILKEKGNLFFKKKKYRKARLYYEAGLKGIMSALCRGPEALKDQNLSSLDHTLNLNAAQCCLNLGEPERGLIFCEKALRRRDQMSEGQLEKALYRTALCYAEMSTKVEECIDVLEDEVFKKNENKAALSLLTKKRRELAVSQKVSGRKMKKMFGKYEGEMIKANEEMVESKKRILQALNLRTKNFWKRCAFQDDRFGENLASSEEEDFPVATEGKSSSSSKEKKMQALVSTSRDMNASQKSNLLLSVKRCDRKCWPEQLRDTVAFALTQYALALPPSRTDPIPSEKLSRDLFYCRGGSSEETSTLWFLGATTTFELQFLKPKLFLDLFPDTVQKVRLVCFGFGEGLSKTSSSSDKFSSEKGRPSDEGIFLEAVDGSRSCTVECYFGPAEEKMEGEFSTQQPLAVFLLHPFLHRYFSSWWSTLHMLFRLNVPFCVIGASAPDPSEKQDAQLLEILGAKVMGMDGNKTIRNPFSMEVGKRGEESWASKCWSMIWVDGGIGKESKGIVRTKIEMVAAGIELS